MEQSYLSSSSEELMVESSGSLSIMDVVVLLVHQELGYLQTGLR
jgi:hypothetical protein